MTKWFQILTSRYHYRWQLWVRHIIQNCVCTQVQAISKNKNNCPTFHRLLAEDTNNWDTWEAEKNKAYVLWVQWPGFKPEPHHFLPIPLCSIGRVTELLSPQFAHLKWDIVSPGWCSSVDWVWAANQRITSLIPNQGICLECGSGPQ